MQTKVIDMGQVAHGDVLPLKPHAVSANYINKMSNYCGSGVYKH
jgi:deoxyribodipyrimidine photolyase-related protein